VEGHLLGSTIRNNNSIIGLYHPHPKFDQALWIRRWNLLDTLFQGTSFFEGKMGIFNLCGMIFQEDRVSSPGMGNVLFYGKILEDSSRIGGDDLCRK
jgi:hypothetical protein